MQKRGLVSVVLFFVFLSVFFYGCSTRQVSPDASQGGLKIYTGTNGLNMKFTNNLPPSRLYDTSGLDIVLELENKGTSDLSGSNCVLHLSGFDPNIVRGIDAQKTCSSSLSGKIEGKSGMNPEGGYSTQEFRTTSITLPDYMDSLPQRILVTACYKYQTKASPVICVDPNPYGIGVIEKVCNTQSASVSGGQGAPVAVTGVKTEMASKDKIALTITVSNQGGGTVFSRASVSECPSQIQVTDYNTLLYEVEMAGSSKIQCSPMIDNQPKLRLTNNAGTIYCTFSIRGENAYTTPLTITLNYNYMNSIFKDIEIIKTPR